MQEELVEEKLKISKRIFLLFLLLLFKCSHTLASFLEEESYLGDLGTVVITGTRIPQPASLVLRNVSIITANEIQYFPVHSSVEVLKYVPGVDLRERGPFGVQADLGLRGATFPQALVLVDGMRMNDPQTGHHNLDLPVNLADLERVEILHGHGSSIYGADAFGGVVNFVTRVPQSRKVLLEAFAGGNRTGGGTFSFSDRFGNFGTLFSLGGKMSDGYRFDTDFTHFSFFSNSRLDFSQASIGLSLGYSEKEFGANDFYGDWPSREWTNTILGNIKAQWENWKNWAVESRLYYREHDDKFIGDITRSDSYANYHTTYLYGGEVQLRTQLEKVGELVMGGEVAREDIDSTRLGNHSNTRAAIYTEYGAFTGKKYTFNPGIRIDHHSRWGWQFSPGVSIGYRPCARTSFHSSFGRSFRAPDYTELYYWSPKNVGNPQLVVEEAWSYELGGDFRLNNWLHSTATVFLREGRNLVDWVRKDSLSPWEATKIKNLDTYGVESVFDVGFDDLTRFSLGYTFLESESQELENYVSKYALSHPRHQVFLGIGFPLIWGIRQNLKGRYKQGLGGKGYFVLDTLLSKSLGQVEFRLGATNLLDASYEEIPGVPMPGTSFDCGINVKF